MCNIKIFCLWPTYWLYPPYHYEHEENLANGEVEKMTFAGSSARPIGFQLVGSEDGCGLIWRHIGFGYYKLISKTKERTC